METGTLRLDVFSVFGNGTVRIERDAQGDAHLLVNDGDAVSIVVLSPEDQRTIALFLQSA